MDTQELKSYLEPYTGHIFYGKTFDNPDDNIISDVQISLTFGFYKKDFNIFLELLDVLLFLINSKLIVHYLNIGYLYTGHAVKRRRLVFVQFKFVAVNYE